MHLSDIHQKSIMAKLPRLPLGQQSFEVLRKQNEVYVDKTGHIYHLVDRGSFYFLSRPRRFGKSLLVSTLKCLFEGRQELFEGLWIAQDHRWTWETHPILWIDFSMIPHETPEELKEELMESLKRMAQKYGITLQRTRLASALSELIIELHEKTGKSVVVLVDEYDKPITDHLGEGESALEIAKANRGVLKQFFGALKGGEVATCLRFVFLTGISKVSKVSIFSDLNNLNDITMDDDYSDLCGYNESELLNDFSEHLEAFREKLQCSKESLLQKLAYHYNGYRFSDEGVAVYNPFSMLNVFSKLKIGTHWFESGSPSFLVNLLKEQHYPLPQIEHLNVRPEIFSTYDLEDLDPTALLFQSGYVTIQDYDGIQYTLGYPNQEVKQGFLRALAKAYFRLPTWKNESSQLPQLLQQESFDDFFQVITSTIAEIPYALNAKRDEAYFHTIFFLLLSSTNILARNEVLMSRGRIDMVVEFPDKVFIFEFKCNQGVAAAIQQIKTKGYAIPYQKTGKTITLVGIDFNTESRNIAEWQVEPFV